jgi:hypothetical protein
LSQWRKREILTVDQILGLENKFPSLGQIEVSLAGVSAAVVIQTMEKDREKQKKRREDWWKESDDYESLYHTIKDLDREQTQKQLFQFESGYLTVLEHVPLRNRPRMDVFIWDFEKTIVFFRSLKTGTFSAMNKMDNFQVGWLAVCFPLPCRTNAYIII